MSKEKMVRLNIDGADVKVPEGMNLIDAAEEAGVHIPNLCYLKGMKGIGACRLCVVEVEGGRNPVIACNTKVKDGMVVRTQTDELKEARKFVIDLILSMHPLDCMTCTKAGICNLQRYAYEFDLPESSFTRKRFGYPVDVANPFIKMQPDYCILCGRCVRVCKEQGTNVLEFMGRGVGAKVTTVVDRALQESNCTFCGSCVDACPVNAIIEADRARKGREWEYEKVNSICLVCGNSCDIEVHLKDGQIMKMASGADKGKAKKYICAYGRYGFDYLGSDSRLTVPMKREKGQLVETSWSDALSIVADKLGKAGKNAGIISTARIMNEDAVTLKALAKDVVGTKNYDTTMSLYADSSILNSSQTALVADSDLIVLVGINPSQLNRVLPALNVSIRKSVARGAKLIVITKEDAKLDSIANASIRGDEAESLKSLVKATINKGVEAPKKLHDLSSDAKVSEDIENAADLFASAKNPIVFASPAIFDAASNLAILNGRAVAVTYESNAKGVASIGLTTEGKSFKEIVSGKTKALYAIGELPLKERPDTDFLIVQNSHITELAKHADVLLPSAVYLETDGSIVDYKGRLKQLPKLVEPAGEALPHREIFMRLGKTIGVKIKKPTASEIKKNLKSGTKLTPNEFIKRNGLDAKPEIILESVCSSLLSSARLLWLVETEKVTLKN